MKAAHKRMWVKEAEGFLFQFEKQLYSCRTAHFGAKTSAWHWGRVTAALPRLIHLLIHKKKVCSMGLRGGLLLHLCRESVAKVEVALGIILLKTLGAPPSDIVEWNGWRINVKKLNIELPGQDSLNHLLPPPTTTRKTPQVYRLNLRATSLLRQTLLLTPLYRDLYSLPATNYSVNPDSWQCCHYSGKSIPLAFAGPGHHLQR